MSKKYGEILNYDIIMEGSMKKSPPQKPKAFFNFITKFSCIVNNGRSSSILGKRWRNRHFVLYKIFPSTQVCLLYFKADPTADSKSIGSIDLVKLTNLSVDVGCAVNRSNVFSIQTVDEKGNNRIYYLCAQSFEMMNRWVEKIVSSLNLNNYNTSRFSSVLTLPSPASQNIPRNLIRVAPHCISTSKLNTPLWSNNTSPEILRFRNNNLIDHIIDNTASSYYNLSPGKSPMFHESLEDPILVEDEDIYKYPCEVANSHAYINLNEEKNVSLVSKTNSPDTIFFTNDDNIFQCKPDSKSIDCPDFQEYKLPDSMVENLSPSQCDIKFPEESEIVENDGCCFDFPLPTRLRSKSTSSSSSSSSNNSSLDEDVSNSQSVFLAKKIESIKVSASDDPNPPSVPKRLNIPESTKPNPPAETVLPIKTPKLFQQKTDSFDLYSNLNDDSLSHLNYVDAENLLLKNSQQYDVFRDSTYSSLTMTATTLLSAASELKCTGNNPGRDTPSKCHCDDIHQSSIFPGSHVLVKDVNPTVEYREICDARTEALLKLSARILNNE